MTQRKVILWDFDGTLAFRQGRWSGALADVLRAHEPSVAVCSDDFRPHLRAGFPWHRPQEAHLHLTNTAQWWAVIEQVLAQAYIDFGLPEVQARKYAVEAHRCYLEPTSWECFADVIPALNKLSRSGWTHVVLSNHVPELAQLVKAVGLNDAIAAVLTSACMGYEKPHPEIFRIALATVGHPQQIWMIGDSYEADVLGAESVGIPAILVRNTTVSYKRCCQDLLEVATFLELPNKEAIK